MYPPYPESEKLKSALLDAVTHDLRTPLTSIKASITMLIEENSQDAIHVTLEREGRGEQVAYLVKHPDKVLTHTVLLQKVWGSYYTESPEALRVLVGTLRKKIEKDFSAPKYLLTEPWIGYRFIPK